MMTGHDLYAKHNLPPSRDSIDLTDDLLDRWIARLEHPSSERARGQLRDPNNPHAMCCLGHLADMLNPDGWKRKPGGSWLHLTVDPYDLSRHGRDIRSYRLASINDGAVLHGRDTGRFPIEELKALRQDQT